MTGAETQGIPFTAELRLGGAAVGWVVEHAPNIIIPHSATSGIGFCDIMELSNSCISFGFGGALGNALIVRDLYSRLSPEKAKQLVDDAEDQGQHSGMLGRSWQDS
jgi:hypothetical protein